MEPLLSELHAQEAIDILERDTKSKRAKIALAFLSIITGRYNNAGSEIWLKYYNKLLADSTQE